MIKLAPHTKITFKCYGDEPKMSLDVYSMSVYKPDPGTWLRRRPTLQQTRNTTRTAPCYSPGVCWWDSVSTPAGSTAWLPW